MKLIVLILLNIVSLSVVAEDKLKVDFLNSCEHKSNRTQHFCACSYEELTQGARQKQKLRQQAQVNFNYKKNRFEQTLNKNAQILISDPTLTIQRIDKLCDKHDELQVYIEQLPQGHRGKIDTRKLSKIDLQNLTLKKQYSKKEIHDHLHRYQDSTKSYQLLINDAAYCGALRNLAKLEQ